MGQRISKWLVLWVMREMSIKPQWDTLTYSPEWQTSLKSGQTASIADAIEKLNFSYIAAGSTICYNHFGKITWQYTKVQYIHKVFPRNSLLEIHLTETGIDVQNIPWEKSKQLLAFSRGVKGMIRVYSCILFVGWYLRTL